MCPLHESAIKSVGNDVGPSDAPDTRPPDPYDPTSLTLNQDFGAATGVKRLLTMVPVRKPNRHEFVCVHRNPSFHLQTAALVYKEDREEIYLVERHLWPELASEIRPIALYMTVNRQNVVSLWPVKLPGTDGRIDTWNQSALDAVLHAKDAWVRVVANMSLGGYEVHIASGELPPPQWPDLSFAEILKIAFRDRFITDLDHIVIKKLRGQA